MSWISIHALREEGDWFHQIFRSAHPDFNPRPPRGGRRKRCVNISNKQKISIHALREEGDHSGGIQRRR